MLFTIFPLKCMEKRSLYVTGERISLTTGGAKLHMHAPNEKAQPKLGMDSSLDFKDTLFTELIGKPS